MHKAAFTLVENEKQRLLQFATILGFLGMMRPHSLEALGPSSFNIVTSDGTVKHMPSEAKLFH